MKLIGINLRPLAGAGMTQIPTKEWAVGNYGLAGDHCFAVASGRNEVIPAHPELTSILPAVSENADHMLFLVPGLGPIEVYLRDNSGSDQMVTVDGEAVAALDRGHTEILEECLGFPAHLVRISPRSRRSFDGHRLAFQRAGHQVAVVFQETLDALGEDLVDFVRARGFMPQLVLKGGAPFTEARYKRFLLKGRQLHQNADDAGLVGGSPRPWNGSSQHPLTRELARRMPGVQPTLGAYYDFTPAQPGGVLKLGVEVIATE